jgi:hypothetical protein
VWAEAIRRCLRLETEQIAMLRHLIATTDHPERLRQYSDMLASKVEIVTILNELLRYGDKTTEMPGP